jgi:hypothetical protein
MYPLIACQKFCMLFITVTIKCENVTSSMRSSRQKKKQKREQASLDKKTISPDYLLPGVLKINQ